MVLVLSGKDYICSQDSWESNVACANFQGHFWRSDSCIQNSPIWSCCCHFPVGDCGRLFEYDVLCITLDNRMFRVRQIQPWTMLLISDKIRINPESIKYRIVICVVDNEPIVLQPSAMRRIISPEARTEPKGFSESRMRSGPQRILLGRLHDSSE